MSHLVLARKYRPSKFSEVVGQEVIIATLTAAMKNQRMAHALLFTGSRGVGKTTIARIVAKAMVCLERIGAEPCNHCSQCVSIDNFSSLDIIEIDGASNTGVDDIRDLRENARYQPSSAKYKIFIIDEVHMLSISAFNALLKILEEPPPHVIFMFATTESHKIPKTILSRCQRYDFKRVSTQTIQAYLKKIINIEGLKISDDGLILLAQMADGGLRDALSLTEQVISNGLDAYSAEQIADILGIVSHQAVKNIANSLIQAQIAPALSQLKNIYEQGLDLYQLCDALSERFRILALCAHLADFPTALSIIPGLEESDFLATKQQDPADLKRLFAMSLDAMNSVAHAPKPLLALELLLLRLSQRPPMSDASTINFCLNKLDAILHNKPVPYDLPLASNKPVPYDLPTAWSPALAPSPAPVLTAAPKPVAAKLNPPPDLLAVFSMIVDKLSKTNQALASHLRHAQPSLNQKQLILSFAQELHYEQILAHKNNPKLLELISELFGDNISLDFIYKKPAIQAKTLGAEKGAELRTVADLERNQREQAEKKLWQEAENHPLVKKTLEIFGGDITSVKRLPTYVEEGV